MSAEIPRSPLVGIVMGSKSDWETMRQAADVLTGLGVPVESKVVSATARRSGFSSTAARPKGAGWRSSLPGRAARPTCRACWRQSRSCRCSAFRSRASTSRDLTRCCRSSRCPGACPWAPWPSVRRRGQRGTARRRHPGAQVPGGSRGADQVPPGPDRRGGRIAGMRSQPGGPRSTRRPGPPCPLPAGTAGGHRQRATGPHVRPGRAADGIPRGRSEHHRRYARCPGGALDGPRPSRSSSLAADDGRPGPGGHGRVRERLGPCPAVACAQRIVRPGWRTVWTSQNRLREKISWPQRHSPRPLAAGPRPSPRSSRPCGPSVSP